MTKRFILASLITIGMAFSMTVFAMANDCDDCSFVPTSTATCWAGGWIRMICENCGADAGTTHGWEAALGHELDLQNYTPLAAPNPNNDPARPRWGQVFCSRGDCTYVRTVNVWLPTVVPPTCTADGHTIWEHWPTGWIGGQGNWVPALGHDFGDFWSLDFTQSRVPHLTNANDPVGTCNRCGWSGYIFHWDITEFEATCTTAARTRYVSTVRPNMGFDFEPWATERYTGEALGHDFQYERCDYGRIWAWGCTRCEWAGYIRDCEGCINCVDDVQPVKLGFIGYFFHESRAEEFGPMSTSFFWLTLNDGEAIDWLEVENAYQSWVDQGGLEPGFATGWISSGSAPITFEHGELIGHGDFSGSVYFVTPGFTLP